MKSVYQVFSFDFLSKMLLGVLSVLLIRFMPEKEYAVYIFALSLISIPVQIISSFFNKLYIIGFKRFQVNQPSSFLGFILIILLFFILVLLPFQSILHGIFWLVVAVIFSSVLSDFSKTFYQQKQNFKTYAAIEFIRSSLLLISLAVLIYFVRSNLEVKEVLILRASVLLVVFLAVYLNKIKLKKIFDIRFAYNSIKLIITDNYKYLFGYIVLLALFLQTDVFMLKSLSDQSAIASYGSAFRYYTLISLALGAVNAVLLPMVNAISTKNELHSILSKHKRLVFIFSPIVLIGAAFSGYIIPLMDMGKYPDAIVVFQIFSISAILSFAFSPHVNFILKVEDFKFLFYMIAVCLIINITLNFFCIPKWHAIGASIATTLSYALLNSSVCFRATKILKSDM